MRVVFLEDVTGVAQGGEVKEVKPGFARNYLIPKRLAALATTDALQRVARLRRQAEETRVKLLTDMRALSELMNDTRVNVEMRAGASGRLYGSVTNAIVAAELSKMTGREIDRRTIELGDSIREVGTYEVRLRLHADVEANISLLVHPMGTDAAEFLASLEEKAQATEEESTEAVAEKESAEAIVEEQPAEAVAEEQPAEAVAEEQPAEAVAEEQPAEAVAEEQPAEAVAEEQPAEAVAEEQPAEAVAEEQPAEAVAEEQPAEATAEEGPAEADTGTDAGKAPETG